VVRAIDLDDRSYIRIDGLTVDGVRAGHSSDPHPATVQRWVGMFHADHNVIQNCTLQYSSSGGIMIRDYSRGRSC
jgi:hypothetical protein